MKRLLWAAVGVGISAALLVLVLRRIDLSAAWPRLMSARLGWLLAATGAALAVLLLRSARFWILARKAPYRLMIGVVALQNAMLRLAPFRAGEAVLPWLLHRAGEPAAESVVSLLIIRLLDLVAVLAAGVGAGLWWFGGSADGLLVLLGGGAVLLIAILMRLGWWLRLGVRIGRWVITRIGLDGVALFGKIFDALDGAADQTAFISRRRWIALAGLTLVHTAVHFAIYGCLLLAFDSALDLRQLVVGTAFMQITLAIPLPTLGSFGIFEAGWIAGFVWVGVPLEEAALMGVATQLITLGFAIGFALPAAAWLLARR